MNAAPAAEIRRRGDRLRRRNTALATAGGVLAVAMLVGVPVALNSGRTTSEIQPAPPAPSPSGVATIWVTEIPEGFPLTDGMDNGPGSPVEGDLDAFPLCETAYPTSRGTADSQTWFYSGDGESSATRVLQLWPDDVSAQNSVAALEAAVQDCPQQPTLGGEDVIESKLVDFRTTGGDESLSFVQQVVADDGLVSQLTTVEVTRVGNAVLIDSNYGSAGGDQAIDIATRVLADASTRTRAAMCVFAAEPCAGSEESDAPTSSGQTSILSDFPLDRGLVESEEKQVTGPGPDVEAIPELDLCGTPAWAPADVTDRLVVRANGLEFFEVRELVTFTDELAAADAVEEVRNTVAACPTTTSDIPGDDQTNLELEAETGFDTFTWGYHFEQGLGGGVYQLTHVGKAVLVIYFDGEVAAKTLQPVADEEVTPVTLDLAPELCIFSDC